MLQVRATARLLHLKFCLVRGSKKETEPKQLRHGKGQGNSSCHPAGISIVAKGNLNLINSLCASICSVH